MQLISSQFCFFSSFELGVITKYLMTGPVGNLNVGLGETKLTVSVLFVFSYCPVA